MVESPGAIFLRELGLRIEACGFGARLVAETGASCGWAVAAWGLSARPSSPVGGRWLRGPVGFVGLRVQACQGHLAATNVMRSGTGGAHGH